MRALHHQVTEVIGRSIPGTEVLNIKEMGTWIQQVFEVRLVNGQELILKLAVHPEWGSPVEEAMKCHFLRSHGLPAPCVFTVDTSRLLLPYPFILQERLPGERLQYLLQRVDKHGQQQIYRAIGETYRKLHSVQNNKSGLMGDTPYETRYPVAPNNYMFRAEIVEGSGHQAVEQQIITPELHQRIIDIWTYNLEYLNAHQPALVHNSCFPWTISLQEQGTSWLVSKLMALGDVLWWDPAYDLALLQYPIFYEVTEDNWQAFLEGYGTTPERKRILLYRLMQLLCAAMGVYMEPAELKCNPSKTLEQLEPILDEVEALQHQSK